MSRPGLTRMLRVPRAALICAAVAFLNALCWSIVTPPFQAPDEPSHFAYVQELAQARQLPRPGEPSYSQQESVLLLDLREVAVHWHPEEHVISSPAEERQLQHDLALRLSRRGDGRSGVSASQPPLYYMLEVVPYTLGKAGTLLDQLELMRLLSAAMGGLTALFCFLFVREALPGLRWAWTVGGMSVAVLPALGMMSGAVNPDAMLYAVCAALFFCLGRAFRTGLTRNLALVLGALTAVGLLTKLNFVGLTPGVVLALILLTIRAARVRGRAAFLSLAYALGIAASPVCAYLLVNQLSGHASLGLFSSAIDATTSKGRPILDEISYIWQFYLPRLPGMSRDYFPGLLTTRDLWFDRAVGLYGWLDTSFPVWVQNLALAPASLLGILGIFGLLAARTRLPARSGELIAYMAIGGGLMVLIGADAYLGVGQQHPPNYAEPRYLLPMLPLFAAVLALAARGAGRRWGPTVGTLIVLLFVAHDIFSQLLVVARFYG